MKEFFEERQVNLKDSVLNRLFDFVIFVFKEQNNVNEQEITDEINPENENSNDVCPELNNPEIQTEDRVSEPSLNVSEVIENPTTLTQHENVNFQKLKS